MRPLRGLVLVVALSACDPDPVATCERNAALRLVTVPENIFAFHHISAACASLEPLLLVRNDGETSVRIEHVTVAPASFTVRAEGLPSALAPGDTLPVILGFVADQPVSVDGALTVSGPDGCSELVVHGEAVADSLITQSAYALDFSDVPAGTTSAPRELVILSQRPAAAPPPTFDLFAAGPEGVFQLFSTPGEVTPESCEEIRLRVSFTAPERDGPVRGDLAWAVTTTTPEGTFESLAGVELLGTSVAP